MSTLPKQLENRILPPAERGVLKHGEETWTPTKLARAICGSIKGKIGHSPDVDRVHIAYMDALELLDSRTLASLYNAMNPESEDGFRESAAPLSDLSRQLLEDGGYTVYPKAKALVGAFGNASGVTVELVGANAYNPDLMMCKWPNGRVMELEAHEYELIP